MTMRTTESLLTLASSEAGLDRREPVDLSAVTGAVLLAHRPDIDRLGLNVETTIRPAPLDGEPLLVERMVSNLIDNAAQHNIPGGRVGEVDRLFQPFQRLDARRIHYARGHGLGLSIIRAIAGAHGATITAEAPSDGGLIITVTFAPTPGPTGRSETESNS